MLIALTGATGFIGQHLLRDLPKRGYRLRMLLRRPASVPMQTASAVIGDLARPQNMSAALEGVDAVIHSPGLGHEMSGVPEDDYRVLNTEATIGLARAARRAAVKRFVFLSSIRAQCGPTADIVLTEAVEPRRPMPMENPNSRPSAVWRNSTSIGCHCGQRWCTDLASKATWRNWRGSLARLFHCRAAASGRAAHCSRWKICRPQSRSCWQHRERCGELSLPPIRRR